MVCRNCGNEMRDDARFCPHCGALNSPDQSSGLPQGAAPYSAPASPVWEGPEGGGGKKKTGLVIGIAVAAVAVIALLAIVLRGVFSNPKKQMEAAFAKTAAAYLAAEEKLGMPDVAQWQQEQSVSQRMSLVLKGINSQLVGYDLSALNGLGLYMDAGYSGEDRQLYAGLKASWGEDDLLYFEMLADDDELYFSFPEFLGSSCYGVNTETLGADLAELTGDNSVQDVSFNLFDLMDKAVALSDPKEMEQAVKEANRTLMDAIEVKKLGARTLDLNGTQTKTAAYRALIPEEALNQYVDDLETALSALNYYNFYEELYQSMGIPQDQVDEMLSALEGLDIYGDLADGLRDAIDELGDVELEVCLSGGYVSAVLYEDEINGSEVKAAVYLGGGEEYVDNLSAEIEIDGNLIELNSTGDHGLKSGVFTDETTLRVRENRSTLARVTFERSIDPKAAKDNFQWKLGIDSSGLSVCVLEMEGDLEMDQEHLSLDLEEVSVRAMGMEVCTLGFRYDADCHPAPYGPTDAVMLPDMTQQELLALGESIQVNALSWADEMRRLFVSRLPQELLWSLMGM